MSRTTDLDIITCTKVQSTIIGDRWWGINSGAKKSLERNYLFQAEKTSFVEILPLHVAVEIAETYEGSYQVSCHQIALAKAFAKKLNKVTVPA